MVINNLNRFFKEFDPSAPPKVCELLIKDAEERDWIQEQLISKYQKFDPDIAVMRDGEPSLFATSHLYVGETMLPGILPENMYAIIWTKSGLPDGILTLDLSNEKPWDRKDRIAWILQAIAHKEGKALTCAKELAQMESFGMMVSELEKLICYVGDEKEIGHEALLAVGATKGEMDRWRLAEECVFDRKKHPLPEKNALYGLIGQVRYFLQAGLKLQTGENVKMRAKLAEKARRYPKEYYAQGLIALAECEMRAKAHRLSPHISWGLFLNKI